MSYSGLPQKIMEGEWDGVLNDLQFTEIKALFVFDLLEEIINECSAISEFEIAWKILVETDMSQLKHSDPQRYARLLIRLRNREKTAKLETFSSCRKKILEKLLEEVNAMNKGKCSSSFSTFIKEFEQKPSKRSLQHTSFPSQKETSKLPPIRLCHHIALVGNMSAFQPEASRTAHKRNPYSFASLCASSLIFSSTGMTLIIGTNDGRVAEFDCNSAQKLKELGVNSSLFLMAGRKKEQEVQKKKEEIGEVRRGEQGRIITSMKFSKDGEIFGCGDNKGDVFLFDWKMGICARAFHADEKKKESKKVHSMEYNCKSEDPSKEEPELEADHPAITSLCFSKDGSHVLCSTSFYQPNAHLLRNTSSTATSSQSVALSSGFSSTALQEVIDGYVCYYSLPENIIKRRLSATSGDSSCLSSEKSGWGNRHSVSEGISIDCVCFSGDWKAAVGGCSDGRIRIWEIKSQLQITNILIPQFATYQLTSSGSASSTASSSKTQSHSNWRRGSESIHRPIRWVEADPLQKDQIHVMGETGTICTVTLKGAVVSQSVLPPIPKHVPLQKQLSIDGDEIEGSSTGRPNETAVDEGLLSEAAQKSKKTSARGVIEEEEDAVVSGCFLNECSMFVGASENGVIRMAQISVTSPSPAFLAAWPSQLEVQYQRDGFAATEHYAVVSAGVGRALSIAAHPSLGVVAISGRKGAVEIWVPDKSEDGKPKVEDIGTDIEQFKEEDNLLRTQEELSENLFEGEQISKQIKKNTSIEEETYEDEDDKWSALLSTRIDSKKRKQTGGGKSTTMRKLAHYISDKLGWKVIMTTTTKIGADQAEGEIIFYEDLKQMKDAISSYFKSDSCTNHLLTIGLKCNGRKIIGISPEWADELIETTDVLLVEADGAAMCPLKMSAFFEPVMPLRTTHVVVCVGADSVNRQIKDKSVHRPLLFSDVLSKPMNSTLLVEDVAKIVISPNGHFKGFFALHPATCNSTFLTMGRLSSTPPFFISGQPSFVVCTKAEQVTDASSSSVLSKSDDDSASSSLQHISCENHLRLSVLINQKNTFSEEAAQLYECLTEQLFHKDAHSSTFPSKLSKPTNQLSHPLLEQIKGTPTTIGVISPASDELLLMKNDIIS
ncbi:uncharacterized protein MONOS_1588 [Monocercomonoides exilis]|uniref:uncharacterized protein n=1 Tax=Monocercomonoides exilis TaxID=2049356 RepID=UPI003559466B|nr:hypothetical protein MONOS_1588 [Monocercomonoides exilis]|eukprot:MONOS_1588.1-p1 / transcript=MONOS_1588.1 / gene=MONOS_1588 / organism=Monocercomonoides_exilis_PA203 / gene_product=unspecified product / transcript_product=unspecified product / location=Mono_scaffold00028:141417-145267(+) / protein_length=1117 / sequence_SO=supercontig / SO=protein_coding / is_pseudo=false